MDKKVFFQQIKEQIKQYLPEDYQEGEVFVQEFNIEGQKRTGFAVIREGRDKIPVLDLASYFEAIEAGTQIEEVLQELGTDYHILCEGETETIAVSMDKEQFYSHLHVAVYNFHEHREALSTVPYLKVNDLAVVPMLRLPTGESIPINLKVAEQIQVSGDLILAKAMKNHASVLPPLFMTLDSAAKKTEEAIPLQDGKVRRDSRELYVLTNTEHAYGAAVLADKQVLDQVGRKLGEDFYIFPVNTNDLLVAPESGDVSRLKNWAEDPEKNGRDKEGFLSDKLYFYDRKRRELCVFDGTLHREKVRSRPDKEER